MAGSLDRSWVNGLNQVLIQTLICFLGVKKVYEWSLQETQDRDIKGSNPGTPFTQWLQFLQKGTGKFYFCLFYLINTFSDLFDAYPSPQIANQLFASKFRTFAPTGRSTLQGGRRRHRRRRHHARVRLVRLDLVLDKVQKMAFL